MAEELFSKNIILMDVEATTKEEVIKMLAEAMEKEGRVNDKDGYAGDVLSREEKANTTVGFKVATPHAKSAYVLKASLAFMKLKTPIKWNEEDEVQYVFQIGVPFIGSGDRHLEILASVLKKLVQVEFREKIKNAISKDEIIELLKS